VHTDTVYTQAQQRCVYATTALRDDRCVERDYTALRLSSSSSRSAPLSRSTFPGRRIA
jgi:hypothetical protein